MYQFPRIRRLRLDFTPYILTLILHSSLWRRERDRHASRFYWVSLRSSREGDQERGGCSLAQFAPSTLLHAHLRPHFGFTKTVFFAISFSIRRLIVHRYVQFCFVFFFVRLLLIPFSLLLVAFGLGYGRFLCIVVQVWFFVLSISQEQEMKWKSVFRFRNDFVHSFFFFSFLFFSFCEEVC